MQTALIESGADIDQTDFGGFTPLHAAAQCGEDRKIELLLQSGAAVEQLSRPPHDDTLDRTQRAITRHGKQRWAKLVDEPKCIQDSQNRCKSILDEAEKVVADVKTAVEAVSATIQPGAGHRLDAAMKKVWDQQSSDMSKWDGAKVAESTKGVRAWQALVDCSVHAEKSSESEVLAVAAVGDILVATQGPETDDEEALWLPVVVPTKDLPTDSDPAKAVELFLTIETSENKFKENNSKPAAGQFTKAVREQSMPWKARRCPSRYHPKGVVAKIVPTVCCIALNFGACDSGGSRPADDAAALKHPWDSGWRRARIAPWECHAEISRLEMKRDNFKHGQPHEFIRNLSHRKLTLNSLGWINIRASPVKPTSRSSGSSRPWTAEEIQKLRSELEEAARKGAEAYPKTPGVLLLRKEISFSSDPPRSHESPEVVEVRLPSAKGYRLLAQRIGNGRTDIES
eukprot:SAG31_NODE_2324_length_5941_cov_1.960801_2_plen_456_part_00